MFYTAAANGAPLKFHLFGSNPIAGAHFDGERIRIERAKESCSFTIKAASRHLRPSEYIYEFKSYRPFESKQGQDPIFAVPDICKDEAGDLPSTAASAEPSVQDAASAAARGSGRSSMIERPERVTTRHWLSLQLSMLMPGSRAPVAAAAAAAAASPALATAYAQWSALHGRGPARDAEELGARMARFVAVHARVAEHNADPGRSYTMHLGRFADW